MVTSRRSLQGPSAENLHQETLALEDASAVVTLVKAWQPTHVFHLAGPTGPRDTPREIVAEYVESTEALLGGIRAAGVRPWVGVASSSAVYGSGGTDPLTEDQPLRPLTPYGSAKVQQELLAASESQRGGLDIACIRLFNLVGPRQRRMLVADLARQVARAEAAGGGSVVVRDLSTERDYVDVRDAVEALCLLAAASPSGPFNVASEVATAGTECLNELVRLSRVPFRVERVADLDEADVVRQCGSSAKLRAAVDWWPRIPFRRSVRDVLDGWRAEVASGGPNDDY
jgi:nucleoside-diphosphate-sugar epimerase